MNYVYVLRSDKDSKLYVGLTNNYQRRLTEHNKGKVKATKGRRPLVLVYLENFAGRTEAAKREKYLKSGQGREELKRVLEQKLPKWRNW